MALAEVSDALWRERQLLELLVFKLEEAQLVLASPSPRWLNHATREVEVVLDQIKVAELARAVEVAQLGSELGLGANPSLRQLADSLDAPWRTIFDQHRRAFLAFTHEIRALARVNRGLLARGAKYTNQPRADVGARCTRIRSLNTSGQTNGQTLVDRLSSSEDNDLPESIVHLQRSAYQSANALTGEIVHPSIVDFLR